MNTVELRRALLLMEQANQIVRDVLGSEGVPPQPTQEAPVIWGRDGLTGIGDPRDASASRHASDASGVIAVHTQVHVLPQAPYRVTAVRVIGEREAGGRHIATVTQNGGSEQVGLFTGYGGGLSFEGMLRHQPGQEIVISNKFTPPELGPLAIALIDSQGAMISDVVASLGLPNCHVCYAITVERR